MQTVERIVRSLMAEIRVARTTLDHLETGNGGQKPQSSKPVERALDTPIGAYITSAIEAGALESSILSCDDTTYQWFLSRLLSLGDRPDAELGLKGEIDLLSFSTIFLMTGYRYCDDFISSINQNDNMNLEELLVLQGKINGLCRLVSTINNQTAYQTYTNDFVNPLVIKVNNHDTNESMRLEKSRKKKREEREKQWKNIFNIITNHKNEIYSPGDSLHAVAKKIGLKLSGQTSVPLDPESIKRYLKDFAQIEANNIEKMSDLFNKCNKC